MTKNILITLGICVALVLGVIGVTKHSVPTTSFGGTSPDFASNYIDWGGITRISYSSPSMIQASSTVCSFQTPNATTTLSQFAARFVLASTSATSVTFYEGATQNAQTTSLGSAYAIAGSAQATVIASSTATGFGDKILIGPNQWLTAGITSSGNNALDVPVGTCQASFDQIN